MEAPRRARFQRLFEDAFADPRSRLAITGATGWLGMALAHMASRAGLSTANGRLRLFASKARAVALAGEGRASVEALFRARPLDGEGWRIAHFAGLGKERTETCSSAEFSEQSDAILDAAFRLIEPAVAPRIAFTSSGAVYSGGALVSGLDESPYGFKKLQHEAKIARWCAERSVQLVIVRVFNVGGPYANKRERYALSSIVDAVLAGQPIRLKAERPVWRSFVHVEELVALMFSQLNAMPPGATDRFDSGGEELVELGELAELARAELGAGEESPIVRRFRPEWPGDHYVGDGWRYARLLAERGLAPAPLREIIADTAIQEPAEPPAGAC